MLPNHENIINVPPPIKRFFNKRIPSFIFQITHKQNNVWCCKFSPHDCPLKLIKVSHIMFENTVFWKKNSAKRYKLSVEMFWSSRLSSVFRIAFSPSLCRIFVYNPASSLVQRIKSSGKSRSSFSFFKKSIVCFKSDLNFCHNSFNWYSNKAEILSAKI